MSTAVVRASRAGRLTWWLNALLANAVAPDRAVGHLTGEVIGLGAEHRRTWVLVLRDLREGSYGPLRLALPEPGDPAGLPGPVPVTRAAVAAGVGIVAASVTFVPDDDLMLWRAWPSTPPQTGHPLGTLAESRQLLREAMALYSRTPLMVEPDDLALAELREYRTFDLAQAPPGVPAVAVEVADTALRVWWLVAMAADLCGRCGRELPADLRPLRPLARRAASEAFSATVTSVGSAARP